MADWRCVASAAEVVAGKIHKVSAGELKLILLAADGEVFAYADRCPHEGHPLSLGELEPGVLICAKHFWEFDIRTGRHVSRVRRPQCDLKPFAARVTGERVEIDVSGTGETAGEHQG